MLRSEFTTNKNERKKYTLGKDAYIKSIIDKARKEKTSTNLS